MQFIDEISNMADEFFFLGPPRKARDHKLINFTYCYKIKVVFNVSAMYEYLMFSSFHSPVDCEIIDHFGSKYVRMRR